MKVTASTSHSPRRSQWNEFLQQPHHLYPSHVNAMKSLTPTSRTSSLRRTKALTLYGKRLSPYSTLEKSLYGTVDSSTGQYKSPSRILFESGYLTHPPSTHNQQHIYENLYTDPSSPRSGKGSDGVGDSDKSGEVFPSSSSDSKYRSNLRDSVQLKGICRECASSKTASCPRHSPPPSSFPPFSSHHQPSTSRHHLHNHPHHRDLQDDVDHITSADSPSSGFSMDRSLCKSCSHPKYDQNHQLNHHVIDITKDSSIKSKEGGGSSRNIHVVPRKMKKKKKSPKEKFLDVDPQWRFQFLQSTLIISNLIAIFLGVFGLFIAGFIAPRPVRLDTFGGQLVITSVYIILTSLVGLYGSRRESCTLLILYGVMIVASLLCRSIFYFIATFVSSSGMSLALSMIAAFLEVILILFAFGLAAEVYLKKLERKAERRRQAESASPASADIASSESSAASTSSSSGGPSSSTSSDKEVLRRV